VLWAAGSPRMQGTLLQCFPRDSWIAEKVACCLILLPAGGKLVLKPEWQENPWSLDNWNIKYLSPQKSGSSWRSMEELMGKELK